MLGTALTQYFRLRDPSQLIRSAWIRPEDIRHYEEIGIHEFKLSGRTKTVAWILKCMRAYAKRSFKSNTDIAGLIFVPAVLGIATALLIASAYFPHEKGCPFISIGGTGNYEAIFLTAVISLLFATMQ